MGDSTSEATDLALREPIPEEVEAQVRQRLDAGEEIRLSLASDIRLDGTYGSAWLVATDRRLLALSPNGKAEAEEIPLAEIETIEIRELHGSGLVKVRTPERVRTMALFSKSSVVRCGELPAALEQLVAEVRPSGELKTLVDRRFGSGHRS